MKIVSKSQLDLRIDAILCFTIALVGPTVLSNAQTVAAMKMNMSYSVGK